MKIKSERLHENLPIDIFLLEAPRKRNQTDYPNEESIPLKSKNTKITKLVRWQWQNVRSDGGVNDKTIGNSEKALAFQRKNLKKAIALVFFDLTTFSEFLLFYQGGWKH